MASTAEWICNFDLPPLKLPDKNNQRFGLGACAAWVFSKPLCSGGVGVAALLLTIIPVSFIRIS